MKKGGDGTQFLGKESKTLSAIQVVCVILAVLSYFFSQIYCYTGTIIAIFLVFLLISLTEVTEQQ